MNAERHIENPRYVSPQKMERLSEWANRKPVIALMGEFSSGKSTLMNLLVGQSILPTQVTATRLPPVWFQYGDKPAFWMDKHGQRHSVDLDDLESVPLEGTRFIRIYLIADQLKKCDLIDTPGISDPNIPTDSWINTIGYANSVVWCTHAGQAWRESERSQWESLPDRLQENSLLLVTRADKIISRIDLDKIHRRLLRETSELFYKHQFMSLTTALKSREEGGDTSLWEKSGGAVFSENLEAILGAIISERNTRLRRYRIVTENEKATTVKDMATVGIQDSIFEGAQAPTETTDDNISVLRPRRVHSTGSTRRPTRLNTNDAANIHDNLLSNTAPAIQESLPTETPMPVAEGAGMGAIKISQSDDTDAPSLRITRDDGVNQPADAIGEQEPLEDTVSSENSITEITTDNEQNLSSGDTSEPEYYRENPEPEAPVDAELADETDETSADESAIEDTEIQSQAPSETTDWKEPPRDEIGLADDVTEAATGSEMGRSSGDTSEPEHYQEIITPKAPVDAGLTLDTEENRSDAPEFDEIEADPVAADLPDQNTEALHTAPQQDDIADAQQSPPEALLEETLDQEPAIETDDVSEGIDTADEAPLDSKPAPDFTGLNSASDIWQEIIATGEIETVPQMLEAVSLLLEQLDEKGVGYRAA